MPSSPSSRGPGAAGASEATTPRQNASARPVHASQKRSVWKNVQAMSGLVRNFVIWLVFTGLFIAFIHQVLIEGNIEFNQKLLDASTTNLLISIFSQAWVILAATTIMALLAGIKQILATTRGTTLAAFLGIGNASGWLTTFTLLVAGWVPNLCRSFSSALLAEGGLLLFFLALPLIGLAFGSILKVQADFQYYFQAGPIQQAVYAGLTPFDNRVLSAIPVSTLCLYFSSWIASLLGNTKYATRFPMEDCSVGCHSFILPAGIESARLALPNTYTLEYPIFSKDTFDNVETIRVNNAPGTVVVYREVTGGFNFDRDSDCLFTGESLNDTIRVCIRQDGPSVIVGWSACPDHLWKEGTGTCSPAQPWASAPIEWATQMSAYRQFTDTSYDRQNFSILDVQPLREKQLLALNATDYMQVFRTIFIPPTVIPSTTTTNTTGIRTSSRMTLFRKPTKADVSGVEALLNMVGWAHRTYQSAFPSDKNSMTNYLHSFMAIPLQWTVTAVQRANYTTNLGFSVPTEHLTTATAGWSRTRLVIRPWTGWTFIGGAGALVLLVFSGLVFIALQPVPLLRETGIAELDGVEAARELVVQRTTTTSRRGRGGGGEEVVVVEKQRGLLEFAPKASSMWRAARDVSWWRVVPRAVVVEEEEGFVPVSDEEPKSD